MNEKLVKAVTMKLQQHKSHLIWVLCLCLLAGVVGTSTYHSLTKSAEALSKDPICGLEEHTHDMSCYSLGERPLVCGLDESEGHTHDESCYDGDGNLICGQEEHEGHVHGDECYGEAEQVLICGREEHIHTAECYPVEEVQPEETVAEEAEGSPAPEESAKPEESAVPEENVKPEEKAEEEGSEALEETAEKEDKEEKEKKDQPLAFEEKSGNVTVKVSFENEKAFKEEDMPVTMKVKPIDEDSEEYEAYYNQIMDETKVTSAEKMFLFDITFENKDGKEVEPLKTASVSFTTEEIPVPEKEALEKEEEQINVVHIPDQGEAEIMDVDVKTTEDLHDDEKPDVAFETDSFSIYGIVYTVDYFMEMDGQTYAWSMEGGTSVSVTDVLINLGAFTEDKAEAFVKDVTDIQFSDETLLAVEQNEDGIWMLKSLAPFDTEETLTFTLKNGEVFTLKVTDDNENYTVDLGNKNNTKDNEGIHPSVSSSVTTTPQSRNASFMTTFNVTLSDAALASLKGTDVPTLCYDLNQYIQEAPITSVNANANKLYDETGSTLIGTYKIVDNVVVFTITNVGWLRSQDRFSLKFGLSLSLDETKIPVEDEYTFEFPGAATSFTITFKEVDFKPTKVVDYHGSAYNDKVILSKEPDGKYRLHYTATISSPADLNSLQFTDVMEGNQKLERTSVKVNDIPVDVSKLHITDDRHFDFNIGDVITPITANTYTVTYSTVIDESDIPFINDGTYTEEKNKVTWKVNGTKDIPGPETKVIPVKPEPPMQVKKTVDKSNSNWQPEDVVEYTVVYGSSDKKMDGILLRDWMTDVQTIVSNSATIQVRNETPVALTGSNGLVWNDDNSYSRNNTNVFSYTVPEGTGYGPITVKYKAKIIDKATAEANGIYDLVNVDNHAEAQNISSETHGSVPFNEKPEHTKTVSPASGSSGWNLGDEITYTLTYGRSDLPLDGLTIYDKMTELQDLSGNITISIPGKSPYSMPVASNGNSNTDGVVWNASSNPTHVAGNYTTNEIDVFRYTFPEDSGNGPVTITYKTKLASRSDIEKLNLYGYQNVYNRFTVNNETKSTTGKIPTNTPMSVSKSVVNNTTTSGSTWKPGDTLTYTIVFGDSTTRMDGVVLEDYMKDIQTLEGDVKVQIGNGSPYNMPVSDQYSESGVTYNITHDDNYDANSEIKLFRYVVPDENVYGPITVTYTTKIIDQQTANSNFIYGLKGVGNRASTSKGGNDNTNHNTDFGPEPVTPITKTVSPTDAEANSGNGWQPGDTLTYTITYGRSDKKMDYVSISDQMTDIQKVIGNITYTNGAGETGTIPANTVATDDNYSTGMVYVFNYTFPQNTGYGPIVITYQTKIVDKDKARTSGIWGTRTLKNTFYAENKNAHTEGDVPYDDEPPAGPVKTVSPTDADANESAGWQPGEELTYSISFGHQYMKMNGRNISDKMTNLQDLITGIKIYDNEGNVLIEEMPEASQQYSNDGVVWNYNHKENVYNDSLLDVFNYTIPSAEVLGKEVYGPLRVEYKTRVISAETAAANQIWGTKTVNNQVTFNGTTVQTTGDVPFGNEPTHKVTVKKTGYSKNGEPYYGFTERSDPSQSLPEGVTDNISGRTLTWYIRVEAKEGSVYPLTNIDVYEHLGQGQTHVLSTYYSLKDLYNLGLVDIEGAKIITDSGDVLTPGVDYSIRFTDSDAIYHFDQMNEGVTICLKTEFASELEYQYEMYNWVGVLTNGQNEEKAYSKVCGKPTEVLANKTGVVDPENRIITWTATLNGSGLPVNPNWNEIYFTDILPEGLTLLNYSTLEPDTPTIHVYINFTDWCTDIPVTVNNGIIQKVQLNDPKWADMHSSYRTAAVNGLSGYSYHIVYKTKITDEEWNNVTSSANGSKEYENTVIFTNENGVTVNKVADVVVSADKYLEKKDFTYTMDDGSDNGGYSRIIGDDIDYLIEVNPNAYTMNNNAPLRLLDSIPTSLDLRTATVKVYKVNDEKIIPARDADHMIIENTLGEEVTSQVNISYNDDSRILVIDGIPDSAHYRVFFTCAAKALGKDDITNRATLVGVGSYTHYIESRHEVIAHSAQASGGMSMRKVDENDPSHPLEGAHFKLYKAQTSTIVWKTEGENKYRVSGGEIVDEIPITIGADENGEYISDANGKVSFGSYSFEADVLYYWIETKAPEGYYAPLNDKHYFVFYYENEGDGGNAKKTAKEYDWAYTEANNITVAAYSETATWNATNSRYRSITAVKKWEGDFDNLYKTRPENIELTLYRIDVDGNETKMGNPVIIRPGTDGAWPSYMWTMLRVADDNNNPYKYTVKEAAVNGYFVEYSDNGEGIETGTITVTNRPIPSKTQITVNKVWVGDAQKPDSVLMTLKQIVTDSEGNVSAPTDATSIENYQILLRPNVDGDWTYTWNDLPVKDGQGGYYSYIVEETVPEGYAVKYSNNGTGVIDSTITVTNTPLGSLKVTKNFENASMNDLTSAQKRAIQFEVTDNDGKVVKTFTLADFTGSEYTLNDIPIGTYRVTEKGAESIPISSGALKEIKYYVGNSETIVLPDGTDRRGPQVSVEKDDVAQVLVVNSYELGKGSLKLTKQVTVNSNPTEGTLADGVYVFTIESTADPKSIADIVVSIKVENGAAVKYKFGEAEFENLPSDKFVEVSGLPVGNYRITESKPANGTILTEVTGASDLDNRSVTVTVNAGTEAVVPAVTFINNMDTTTVSGTKTWLTKLEITENPVLQLTRWTESNVVPEVVRDNEGNQIQPEWTSDHKNYEFTNIPSKDGEGNVYTYAVSEISFKIGSNTYTVKPDGTVTAPEGAPGFVMTREGYNITNTEVRSVSVTKKWELNGTETTDPGEGINKLTFLLRQNGSYISNETGYPVKEKTDAKEFVLVKAGETWQTITIENLPKYYINSQGNIDTCKYSVEETGIYADDTAKDLNEWSINYIVAASLEGLEDSNGQAVADTGAILIINSKYEGVELPHTGGPGTGVFTFLGILLIATAGILLLRRKRNGVMGL